MTKGEAARKNEGVGCIVVPPFLKYAAGPLLGPAILLGAAQSVGMDVWTVDLNIDFIRNTCVLQGPQPTRLSFYGDHSKPGDALERAEERFWPDVMSSFPGSAHPTLSDVKRGWYSHDQVAEAAERFLDSELGGFLRTKIHGLPTFRLAGLSVMWAGQVVPALAVSKIVKAERPRAKVVWGGAHVTARAEQIETDTGFGRWVDGFLPGHCEESFVELLSSVSMGGFRCGGLVIPGQGTPKQLCVPIIPPPLPVFPDLRNYGYPKLMLPIELSVGCPYARCAFCTYPAVEGSYARFPFDNLHRLIDRAVTESAAISFKDSLLPAPMLRAVALIIEGRVEWSACTKLAPNLDLELLSLLTQKGCRTLEVGLESLNPETQRRIDKIQSIELLDRFLNAAASAGISVVINYITGFPWEDAVEAEKLLQWLKEHLREFDGLVARVEHNHFNLETMSPMARQPDKYDLKITSSWPWSSILEWEVSRGMTSPLSIRIPQNQREQVPG